MSTLLEPTPSQTVGPYLHIGMGWMTTEYLMPAGHSTGEQIVISGRLLDGDGKPVPDGMIEIWQADAAGRYAHAENPSTSSHAQSQPTSSFTGFGRMPTDANGGFKFVTIKPGPVSDGQGSSQAPHILVSVFMRGILKRLVTRIYFPDEPLNDPDPILQLVPADRRHTLIARRTEPNTLEWNVLMQGANETVFFDC